MFIRLLPWSKTDSVVKLAHLVVRRMLLSARQIVHCIIIIIIQLLTHVESFTK